MDPVLKHYFNNFKSSFEISTLGSSPDEEKRKESDAFEKFVNYVMFSLDYPDIFTAEMDLLDYVCVGGSHDTGIDGIGIRINDRIVQSKDDVMTIVQSSKKINVEFVFIQSKMKIGFDTGEFYKFGTGVKNFFTEGYLPENPHIREVREIKDFIYSNQDVIKKFDKNPSLYLYYVGVGTEPTDDNIKGAINLLKKELNQGTCYFELIELEMVGGKELIKCCKELENQFEVQLNIIDIFPLIVDLKPDIIKKAYAFTCRASEFLKIIKKDDGLLRRSLFNDNVRDYLGNKTAVNSEIETTIVESPEMFLLCNNGITIVCSNFEQVRDKLVKIENPQIVNGCQTSNSIFNYKDNPNIEKIQLLIRLISTDSIDVSNKIVRGTNKQNQVLDEAFETTLPFHQETLEPFFIALDSTPKMYYERRSKQYNNDPLIRKTQIVNLRILTQTFVAMFLESPHESHRHEAKLLELYAENTESRKIFHPDHSPYPYYICALTWHMFDKYFRDEKIDKKYVPYKAHLFLIFLYSLGEYPPRLTASKAMDKYCERFRDMLGDDNFKSQVKKAVSAFDAINNDWLKQGGSRFGIKDNKDFTNLLIRYCRNKFLEGQKQIQQKLEKRFIDGQILNITWRENNKWFGFIKRPGLDENLFFESKDFSGDPRRLVPGQKVRYQMGGRTFATKVSIVE